jgi:DUF438 domain-containing protein
MELIKTGGDRVAKLVDYLKHLGNGRTTRETWDEYSGVLESATSFEVNAALSAVLSDAPDVALWKGPVAKFIRAVSNALDGVDLPVYPEGSLFARLDAENGFILDILDMLKGISCRIRDGIESPVSMIQALGKCSALGDHYVSLQNELFPLFEAASSDHACVKLMWSIEDDVLALKRRIEGVSGLSSYPVSPDDLRAFWKDFGEFFLQANTLVWRERRILFPVAFRAAGNAGASGSTDSAGAAGENPLSPFPGQSLAAFVSETGALTNEQLEAIFSVLPVDIAFIGSDDRVKFYSDPPHRIFPRNPAVIGRLVHNCHPPKSVAAVEEILRSFKNASRDAAEFWLEINGRFIHIEYFAVRDPAGLYLGTLEVSQDATHLRSLEGEKRLL